MSNNLFLAFKGILPLVFFFNITNPAKALDLRVGDILLQPLNCWTCSLIEAQEKSIYSHMGIYFSFSGQGVVLEASDEVKFTPLKEFLKKTEKGQRVLVKRFKNRRFSEKKLLLVTKGLEGLSYDSDFLWHNFNERGEKMYCSELAYKLFYPFYGQALPLKRMSYDINREHWIRYFKGDPPDGKWGNSPADFEKSEMLSTVGEI